jgi:hypothetical protein
VSRKWLAGFERFTVADDPSPLDFLTILLAQAGIKDQNKILTLNFVNSVTSFVGGEKRRAMGPAYESHADPSAPWAAALTGTAIVDKVGRRKLMLFACCCCCVGMFIVGGLLSPAGPQTIGRANAGISFIFLFMVFVSNSKSAMPLEPRIDGCVVVSSLSAGLRSKDSTHPKSCPTRTVPRVWLSNRLLPKQSHGEPPNHSSFAA